MSLDSGVVTSHFRRYSTVQCDTVMKVMWVDETITVCDICDTCHCVTSDMSLEAVSKVVIACADTENIGPGLLSKAWPMWRTCDNACPCNPYRHVQVLLLRNSFLLGF